MFALKKIGIGIFWMKKYWESKLINFTRVFLQYFILSIFSSRLSKILDLERLIEMIEIRRFNNLNFI